MIDKEHALVVALIMFYFAVVALAAFLTVNGRLPFME